MGGPVIEPNRFKNPTVFHTLSTGTIPVGPKDATVTSRKLDAAIPTRTVRDFKPFSAGPTNVIAIQRETAQMTGNRRQCNGLTFKTAKVVTIQWYILFGTLHF